MFLDAWFNPYLSAKGNDTFRIRQEIHARNWSAIWWALIWEDKNTKTVPGCWHLSEEECWQLVGENAIEWTTQNKSGHELFPDMIRIMRKSVVEELTKRFPKEPEEPDDDETDETDDIEALKESLLTIKGAVQDALDLLEDKLYHG